MISQIKRISPRLNSPFFSILQSLVRMYTTKAVLESDAPDFTFLSLVTMYTTTAVLVSNAPYFDLLSEALGLRTLTTTWKKCEIL